MNPIRRLRRHAGLTLLALMLMLFTTAGLAWASTTNTRPAHAEHPANTRSHVRKHHHVRRHSHGRRHNHVRRHNRVHKHRHASIAGHRHRRRAHGRGDQTRRGHLARTFARIGEWRSYWPGNRKGSSRGGSLSSTTPTLPGGSNAPAPSSGSGSTVSSSSTGSGSTDTGSSAGTSSIGTAGPGSQSSTAGTGSTTQTSSGSSAGTGTTTGAGTSASAGPVGVSGSWKTIFDDEFSGTALNQQQWNPNWYGSPTKPSDGVSSTAETCYSPAEVTEGGGDLSLGFTPNGCTADNGKVYPYTGSLINTSGKFTFTYGFMEARIYVPTNASGQLINSLSFWADGTGNWPATGELDVMELLDGCGPHGSPGFSYHFHSPSGGPGGCAASASTGGWHTFGADWEPGKVTYYYDGKVVGSITNGITGAPMYLILSHSASVYASPVIAAAQARVDYVRVWQKAA